MSIVRLLACLWALPAIALAQDHPEFATRITTEVAGVTIESDPADGEHVRALVERLKQPEPTPARDPLPLGIAELRAQRDQVLADFAANLALPRPTPLMIETFDYFAHATAVIYSAMIEGRPSRYSLWRKPDLIARLRAGQTIPGFELDGADVLVKVNVSYDTPRGSSPQELTALTEQAWRRLVWPVQIGKSSPATDIDASLANLHDFRRATAGAEQAAVMNVLHEAVEATLVGEVLRSPDRRWFCEGVANFVALQAIRKRVGGAHARQYYDLDALLSQVGQSSVAELEKWPVAEAKESRHVARELNEANYVRATAVIQRLADKHGESLLPRWLAEIRKTPASKADLQTVYAAYEKVTGEQFPRN